jgi:glyoxylase-like metal-dependent hydrolase (beta-lactamase superfamily II)
MDDELFLEQIECGPMQNFVYAVGSRETREVVLVDPAWAIEPLVAHVREQGFEPIAALVTHYHPDHVGGSFSGHKIEGLRELLDLKGMKVYANKHEAQGLQRVTGISDSDIVKVDSGDQLKVGNIEIDFLHTPGHTPGSQCFLVDGRLVSGDTLFIGSCGRTDLPGSNPTEMYYSLTQRLGALPDETVLLPGHNYGGASSSIGREKRQNPFLHFASLGDFLRAMGGGCQAPSD